MSNFLTIALAAAVGVWVASIASAKLGGLPFTKPSA